MVGEGKESPPSALLHLTAELCCVGPRGTRSFDLGLLKHSTGDSYGGFMAAIDFPETERSLPIYTSVFFPLCTESSFLTSGG